MQSSKYCPSGDNDREKLLDAMKQLKEGVFNPIDESVFEDASLAEGFNDMLSGIIDRNNRFVMRLNDAQIRIADNTSIRELINEVKARKDPIFRLKNMASSSRQMIDKNWESQIEVMSLTKQAHSTVEPAMYELKKAREEFEKGDIDSAKESFSHTERLLEDVIKQLGYIKKKTVEKYADGDESRNMFNGIEDDVNFLYDTYEQLMDHCYMNGQRMYRISRDIDNARNDMYRKNASVSLIDKTKIFSVDHLTVVWRLYNHAMEYETLKITQVNNSDTCKFGLWCENLDIPEIKESEEFNQAFVEHKNLHEHAIACFVAKEASDIPEALKEFEILTDCWQKFDSALNKLAEFMAANGFAEETEVWKFEEAK